MDAPFLEAALSSEATSAAPRKVIGEWTGGAAASSHARVHQPPQVYSESQISHNIAGLARQSLPQASSKPSPSSPPPRSISPRP